MLAAVAEYRDAMQQASPGRRNLDVWYAHIDVDGAVRASSSRSSRQSSAPSRRRALAKARTRDSMQAFAKLTHEVDGEPRIIGDPPLIVPIEDLLPADVDATERRGGAPRR